MAYRYYPLTLCILFIAAVLLMPCAALLQGADLRPETVKAWDFYVQLTERRIAEELSSPDKFLALDFQSEDKARRERRELFAGEIPVIQMRTYDAKGREIEIPDGIIHHWRGSVFIPGVALDSVFARVANPSIEDTRQEDVLDSAVIERTPGSLKLYLKLQRSKIITVVYNTEHRVYYQRRGADKAWSRSTATKIAELDNPESINEQEKPEGHDRGFLWRMNSYWRYQQVNGGVLVECESVTLSRTIPAVLKYFINPLINKVARESMERTLDSMRNRLIRSSKSNAVVTTLELSDDRAAASKAP